MVDIFIIISPARGKVKQGGTGMLRGKAERDTLLERRGRERQRSILCKQEDILGERGLQIDRERDKGWQVDRGMKIDRERDKGLQIDGKTQKVAGRQGAADRQGERQGAADRQGERQGAADRQGDVDRQGERQRERNNEASVV